MAPASQMHYHKDERVLCFHHEILYEAKILDLRHTDPDDRKSPYEYLVHYKGWKNTYVSTHCLPLSRHLYLRYWKFSILLASNRTLYKAMWAHRELKLTLARWDDWVPQDRLRKFTDENRELATTLRREAEAAFRQKPNKAIMKKRGGSDRSSARGSEERQMSVPGRGTKRARENDIEKVSLPLPPPFSVARIP